MSVTRFEEKVIETLAEVKTGLGAVQKDIAELKTDLNKRIDSVETTQQDLQADLYRVCRQNSDRIEAVATDLRVHIAGSNRKKPSNWLKSAGIFLLAILRWKVL